MSLNLLQARLFFDARWAPGLTGLARTTGSTEDTKNSAFDLIVGVEVPLVATK